MANQRTVASSTPAGYYVDKDGKLVYRKKNELIDSLFYPSVFEDVSNELSPEALEYWNSLDEDYKQRLLEKNYAKEVDGILGWFNDDVTYDIDDIVADLENVIKINGAMPVEPTRADAAAELENDITFQKYIDELQASENRQTQFYQDQLRDNQAMFDDYRSQILGNQYQQQAQLMGTVGSEMSKARRNALEAGASAGLRMAENINTTLAMQNKQSQISLETSNQLAQQLLNQRQAAAGIRGEYNSMLDSNSAERRKYTDSSTQRLLDDKRYTYEKDLANWENSYNSSSNPFAENYRDNIRNKATSQYGGGK